jgi:hypothetical protein
MAADLVAVAEALAAMPIPKPPDADGTRRGGAWVSVTAGSYPCGFDGVELDNVDGWTNDTGFPITRDHQRRYLRILAREAIQRGLSPGLKNALGLIPDVVDRFGWALNEQCLQYDECGRYRPFVEAGKAVFVLEYRGTRASVCGREPAGTSVQLKRLRLDERTVRCRYRPPG